MNKSIDELVASHREKQSELISLGQEIARSATAIVVAFVDLSESTQLKHDQEPEAWLGYVYGFIAFIDGKCRAALGTTVKRIGDELMLTFPDVAKAESFIQSLLADDNSFQYTFKIALDAGDVYHFKFEEKLADDPYGPVVDRCARIAKLAGVRTALCSSAYRDQVDNAELYIPAGAFSLRGFPKPTDLFVRTLTSVDAETYLEPLLSVTNDVSVMIESYRTVSRKLTTAYIRNFGSGRVRPFLARELLNVPRLPYSAEEFVQVLNDAGNSTGKEQEFYGFLVEWDCEFDSYTRDENQITVSTKLLGITNSVRTRASLMLPLAYSEIIRDIKKGQRLHVRGIIDRIFVVIHLNYVDVSILADESA